MTLHQAIERVLQETGRAMTSREIADLINQRKMYSRGDGQPVPATQVSARVKNYENLFLRKTEKIELVKNDVISLNFEKYRRELAARTTRMERSGYVVNKIEVLQEALEKLFKEDFNPFEHDEKTVSEPSALYSRTLKREKLITAYHLCNWYLGQSYFLESLTDTFAGILASLKWFANTRNTLVVESSVICDFLLKIAADNSNSSFTVNSKSNNELMDSRVRSFNCFIENLIISDNPYLEEGDKPLSTGIFIPPFGTKSKQDIPIEFESVHKEIVHRNLNLDRALLVVPADVLSSKNLKYKSFRTQLVESGFLDTVVDLPDQMLEKSSIDLALMLFDFNRKRDSVFFVNSRHLVQNHHPDLSELINSRMTIADVSSTSTKTSIKDRAYDLAPIPYVMDVHNIAVEEGATIYELNDLLVERKTGHLIENRQALYTGGEYKLIRATDLSFDSIHFKASEKILGIDQDQVMTTRLVNGGIAISTFNKKIKANVLSEEENYLIDKNIFWLKANRELVIEEYLVQELLKPYVARQVEYYSKGAAIQKVNLSNLLKFKIQVPSLEIQQREVLKSLRRSHGKLEVGESISETELDFIKTLKHTILQPTASFSNDFRSLSAYLSQKMEKSMPLKADEPIVPVFKDDTQEMLKKISLKETLIRMDRSLTDMHYILGQAMQIISVAHPKKKEIELRQLAENIKTEFSGIRIEVLGEKVEILADPKQLRILLCNFIENAKRHGFEEGSTEDLIVWIDIKKKDSYTVQLYIRNNGKSLPKEFTIQDFLAKGGSSKADVGSGFGGFLIGQIVKNHNGEIALGNSEKFDLLPHNVEFIVSLHR